MSNSAPARLGKVSSWLGHLASLGWILAKDSVMKPIITATVLLAATGKESA